MAIQFSAGGSLSTSVAREEYAFSSGFTVASWVEFEVSDPAAAYNFAYQTGETSSLTFQHARSGIVHVGLNWEGEGGDRNNIVDGPSISTWMLMVNRIDGLGGWAADLIQIGGAPTRSYIGISTSDQIAITGHHLGNGPVHMCQVFVVDALLSDAELTNLAAGATINDLGYAPRHWWKLNDANDLLDYGTAGNDLIKTGSPTTVAGPSVLVPSPTPILLSGNLLATSTIAGSIDTQPALSGGIDAVSQLFGAVDRQPGLIGAMVASSTMTALLDNQPALTATIVDDSALSGSVDTQPGLAGAIHDTTSLVAALSLLGQMTLAGEISAHSAADGALSVDMDMAGGATATSGYTGTLMVDMDVAGSIVSQSDLMGAAVLDLLLRGDIEAASTLHADLAGIVAQEGWLKLDTIDIDPILDLSTVEIRPH